jgi:hypothetical protein
MENPDLAQALDEVADLLEIQGANPFRVRAYRAHAVEELGFLGFGVYQARRGGLEAKDVVNTRPLAYVRKLLARRPHEMRQVNRGGYHESQ